MSCINKNSLITILIFLILIISGLFLSVRLKQSFKIIETDNQTTKSKIIPLNEEWFKYVNPRLGFSIKVPKQTMLNTACVWNKERKSYTYGDRFNRTKIFEIGNTVWFAPEYDYPTISSSAKDNESQCQEKKHTINEPKKRNPENSDWLSMWNSLWEIKTAVVKNDKELDIYIKNNFGQRCGIVSKTLVKKDLYKINVFTDPIEPYFKGACVRSTTVTLEFYYSPKTNLVYTWIVGGNGLFFKANKTGGRESVEGEMIDSFSLE